MLAGITSKSSPKSDLRHTHSYQQTDPYTPWKVHVSGETRPSSQCIQNPGSTTSNRSVTFLALEHESLDFVSLNAMSAWCVNAKCNKTGVKDAYLSYLFVITWA